MNKFLPGLPETDYGLAFFDEGGAHTMDGAGYTADQLRAYAEQALLAERERCIQIIFDELGSRADTAHGIAAVIRMGG